MNRAFKLIPLTVLVAAFTATATPAMAASAPKIPKVIEAGVNVIQAPAVLSASTNPRAIGAYGGKTLVVGRVRTSVTTCQRKLLSHQSFPVIYASNVRRCHVNFYAYVTLGANPTHAYRSVAFELIARNAWGQFSRGVFYINVAPKGSNFNPGPPPVVKINDPPPPPPPVIKKAVPYARPAPAPPSSGQGQINVTQGTSNNWSGYEVTGSGFTSVTGPSTSPNWNRTKPARPRNPSG